MRLSNGRVQFALLAGLLALAGCETSPKLGDLLSSTGPAPEGTTGSTAGPAPAVPAAEGGDPPTTGSIGGRPPVVPGGPGAAPEPPLLGRDPNDDLNQG